MITLWNASILTQNEMGKGVCEFHIFDPGNFGHLVPPELERAHYHQWGLVKQEQESSDPGILSSLGRSFWGPAEQDSKIVSCPSSTEGRNQYCGLRDTIKQLGHKNLDVIDGEC